MKIFTPEEVILQNLDLQTTQRELNKMGVYKPSLQLFKSTRFLSTFNMWHEEKRNNFIRLIGGKRYFKQVKGFLEKENYENVI